MLEGDGDGGISEVARRKGSERGQQIQFVVGGRETHTGCLTMVW